MSAPSPLAAEAASLLQLQQRPPNMAASAAAAAASSPPHTSAHAIAPPQLPPPAHDPPSRASTRAALAAEDASALSSGHTLIAGALAGLVAETLMHPFDTLSLRAKVHPSSAYGSLAGAFRVIYAQEGLRGFFSGLTATVCSSVPSTAVYFTAYETLKGMLNEATGA